MVRRIRKLIYKREREMRVEALRLREGNWLSGVGSKDSSWPWL